MAEELSVLAEGTYTAATSLITGASPGGTLIRKWNWGVIGGTARTMSADFNAATPQLLNAISTVRVSQTYGYDGAAAVRYGWNGYLFIPDGVVLRGNAPSAGTVHYSFFGINNPSDTYGSVRFNIANVAGAQTVMTASGTVVILGIWTQTGGGSLTSHDIAANGTNIFETNTAGTYYISGPVVLSNGNTLTVSQTVGAGTRGGAVIVSYITL